jgi:hypothetical protein
MLFCPNSGRKHLHAAGRAILRPNYKRQARQRRPCQNQSCAPLDFSKFDDLVTGEGAGYIGAVKQPIINVEEKIDRIVGRRTKMPDPLSTASSNIADSIAWRKALGGVRVPRGVHRFKTHEEADLWLMRMIAR